MADDLSIIVPVYGVEKYLRQCLDSIAAQSFKDFECILVDDGSLDGCPVICDEYVARDARFKVIHKMNEGYGAAVNAGLDAARCTWIGIVEPDDWIEPEMYRDLISMAVATGVDVAKSGFDTFYDDGRRSWWTCLSKKELPAAAFMVDEVPRLFMEHPSIWTCVYRRRFLSDMQIRMEESPGATWQDNLFQVQSLVMAKSISYVSKKLYHYRIFDDRPLEDALLPLRRSLQVRQWLKTCRPLGEAADHALRIRELNYIRMVVHAARLKELPKISKMARAVMSYDSRCGNDNFCNWRIRCMMAGFRLMPLLFALWVKFDVVGRIRRACS